MSETATPARRGLDGVVAAQTRLSHVDGQAGQLIIGGYELKDLAGHVSFEEAAAMLWNGALPNPTQLADMRREIAELRALPKTTLDVIEAAAKAPPIDVLRMACATLSLDLANPDDISADADRQDALMLMARFPTIVAAHVRIAAGEKPIAPRADLGLAANFLYMVNGKEPDPIAARALDTYWVTVIDHGMNASTFTARVIASTRSDMVSAVTGAIGALKGPLHGGAPGPVLDMLVDIKTADNAEPWLRREIAEGRRIMGFGHRVYKVRDPRAEVLSKVAEEMGAAHLEDRRLFDLARHVEQTALKVLDELKPGRGLKTNVEFYTALVLQSIGLKPRTFVAMFACGRVAGWCAHVIEQHREDHLIRPQSEYIGPRGLKVER
ncbi:MAG TPA: citrate synthase/methylcitrate synthase [Candidatus Udaeobacter sp.]|jgi:citrate synthase|nr:citrate synthase/methylcitrate synthase [Candidatus Udaeobacter sp.]